MTFLAPALPAPLSHLDSPREVVRQFTPNWFAATMGTGIVAIVLGQVPALRPLGQGLWLFNIGLFALFTALYAARWIAFPREARRVFDHPVMSMFFGCIPMGLATIVNGFVVFGPDLLAAEAFRIGAVLWRVDAGLALACGLIVPLLMFTRQEHGLERMTALWLLPIVPGEVTAASGGLLVPHLTGAADRLDLLVGSYALWAISAPLALGVLVVLLLRLILHKLPEAGLALSNWLALGPVGTGALGLLQLGQAAPAVLRENGLGDYAGAFHGACLLGGLMLWGYGVWWLAVAALASVRQARHGLPFNLGWWGCIFPLGAFTLATLRLAAILPIKALATGGHGLVMAVIALWLLVAAKTLLGAWTGALFHAPCLRD